MTSGKHKSRTFRRVFTRMPSSYSKLVYKRRRPGKINCSHCGQELHGVLNNLVIRLKNMPKTTKRPSRPYAGTLCSACGREMLKEAARA